MMGYDGKDQLLEITCTLLTWWFWRGGCTRSHSELGRETPQRRWYFVLRHGRVGRCQVCKLHVFSSLFWPAFGLVGPRERPLSFQASFFDAGWSSPVARQAHNLKAAGSNPAPATKPFMQAVREGGFFYLGFRLAPTNYDVLTNLVRHFFRIAR